MMERFIICLLCYVWLYAFGLCSFGFAVKPEFRGKYSLKYFLASLLPVINNLIWSDVDGQYRF